MAKPGWYADPGGDGSRYWDGSRWCAAVPASPVSGTTAGRIVIGVAIGALVFGIGAACVAGSRNLSAHEGGTTYPDDWSCVDPTPKKDGACVVSHGGVFDTGVSAGWIRTDGARAGESCSWRRLDGPSTGLEHVIDAGSGSGPAEVHIGSGDYAFWSQGCLPWQRISHD